LVKQLALSLNKNGVRCTLQSGGGGLPREALHKPMPSDSQDTPPTSIAGWVKALFEELHDPQVLEVVLTPGIRSATVECRGTGSVRRYELPGLFVAGVLGKMKKVAYLDVAERRREQRGRVRMLDFHGSVADFEVSTAPAGEDETMTLRRVIT